MDVPIKFNRLKKATAQPTPEEHLALRQLPFRSLLQVGAVGYLMTSTTIVCLASPMRTRSLRSLVSLLTTAWNISTLYLSSLLTSKSIQRRSLSMSMGGMSSLHSAMRTAMTLGFIFQLPDSSCFTEAIRSHGPAERNAPQHARWANQSLFCFYAVRKSCSICVCSKRPYSNRQQHQVPSTKC
jgi:hypothetical protein